MPLEFLEDVSGVWVGFHGNLPFVVKGAAYSDLILAMQEKAWIFASELPDPVRDMFSDVEDLRAFTWTGEKKEPEKPPTWDFGWETDNRWGDKEGVPHPPAKPRVSPQVAKLLEEEKARREARKKVKTGVTIWKPPATTVVTAPTVTAVADDSHHGILCKCSTCSIVPTVMANPEGRTLTTYNRQSRDRLLSRGWWVVQELAEEPTEFRSVASRMDDGLPLSAEDLSVARTLYPDRLVAENGNILGYLDKFGNFIELVVDTKKVGE
jgi:hypothetical protein